MTDTMRKIKKGEAGDQCEDVNYRTQTERYGEAEGTANASEREEDL